MEPNVVDLTPPAARGSFKKPPLDPVKLFIIKFFSLKSTTLGLEPAPTKIASRFADLYRLPEL